MIEIVAFAAFLYFLIPVASEQFATAHRIGNAPSGIADAPSEFDALTSAMHYYKNGFLKHAGLPNRAGPPGKPYDDPADIVPVDYIYTHYPPGPNWLVGLAMKIFGPKQVPLYRIFPISFSIAGLLITYALLRSVVGGILAAAALITVLHFPMTTQMMHGLFFHPYALTLVLVQMSFLFNRLGTKSRLSWRSLLLLAGMSFIQGWMSFDWAFVAMLFPLAVVSCWSSSGARREMLKACIFSVMGFGFAHFLHFCQVWALAPTFDHAFKDLFGAAKFRIVGEGDKIVPENATMRVLNQYIWTLFPSPSQGYYFSWLMPLVSVALTLAVGTLQYLKSRDVSVPRLVAPGLISVAMAILLSLLWVLVMKNHSLEQGHWLFLPRHFIVVLFSCVLVAVSELHTCARMVMDLITATLVWCEGRFGRKAHRIAEG
jgi:hypothetical protein